MTTPSPDTEQTQKKIPVKFIVAGVLFFGVILCLATYFLGYSISPGINQTSETESGISSAEFKTLVRKWSDYSPYVLWATDVPDNITDRGLLYIYPHEAINDPLGRYDPVGSSTPLLKFEQSGELNYSTVVDNIWELPNAPVDIWRRDDDWRYAGIVGHSDRYDKLYFDFSGPASEGLWLEYVYILDSEDIEAGFTKAPLLISEENNHEAINTEADLILGFAAGTSSDDVLLYDVSDGTVTTLVKSSELAEDESIFYPCMGDGCNGVEWRSPFSVRVPIYGGSNGGTVRELIFGFDPNTRTTTLKRVMVPVTQEEF